MLHSYPKTKYMKRISKPVRLLIVEDNPGDYILLKKLLQRTAIPVESFQWAKSLAEVEAVVKTETFDMVFLDLTLPDSDGVESFSGLSLLLASVPVIVLSGMSDMELAVETIALGAQDYLVKGEFDEKLLAKTMQYAFERIKILRSLRESNERFELVNKATMDVIWDWNLLSNALHLSSSVKQIFGFTEQAVDLDWLYRHIHPEDLEGVQQVLESVPKSGQNTLSIEYRLQLLDGSYRHVYSRGYVLYNSEGVPYRMIGAANDLTEKRKLEEELIKQRLRQQKLITETTIRAQEKERNELGKELHDNINQVLATIKMFLSIARQDASLREDLINRCHENISYAIEEIRRLSKSLVPPSLRDIGIAEALQELADEVNLTKSIVAEVRYENQPNRKLDAGQQLMLYRIVQEQMNNVLKYSQASKAVIDLRVQPQQIYLSVADNGVGFDPAQKARGIGLKNIASRVEFYAGKMHLEAAPGQGCKMEVVIPV